MSRKLPDLFDKTDAPGRAGTTGPFAKKHSKASASGRSTAKKSGKTRSEGKTKADLIDAVYHRHGALTKLEAAKIVDAIFDTVKSTLVDGRPVRIRNFGVFEVMHRSGRTGVNPASGEKMFIPPHFGLSFRPSRNLKMLLQDDDD